MPTTIAFEDEILKLIFNGTDIPAIADDAALTPATEFFVALHTEDPTKSSNPLQTSAEIAYTAYARQAVPRTEAGWAVENGQVVTEELIEFPEVDGVTGTPRVATYFSIGSSLSGGGKVYFSGKLTPPITISNGSEPRIDNQSVASRFEPQWA
ncbi:MAG: hypothetical protein ABWY64_13310 [Tardiphaga sp.]